MSLSKEEQFQELVQSSTTPLILLPPHPTHDLMAAAIGLSLFLEKIGKTVAVGGDGLSKNQKELSFLPAPTTVLSTISGARDFVLSFNTEFNPILDVKTERTEKELRISLTPERGTIDPRDFSFILAKYKYDLVITLGVADKESLGKMYENNPDIFFEVPLINIDCRSENEQFGQLNLVDITASSVTEIVTLYLEQFGKELPTGTIAEALLTGILAATESFQRKNTTPRALELASRLMAAGADQQTIVKNLYKTQPLHLLKLWGRLMANAHYLETEKIIWAPVTIEDLVESRSKMDDLLPALDKLRASFSGATVFALFFKESDTRLRIFIKTADKDRLRHILSVFSAGKLVGDALEGELELSDFTTAENLLCEWVTSFA